MMHSNKKYLAALLLLLMILPNVISFQPLGSSDLPTSTKKSKRPPKQKWITCSSSRELVHAIYEVVQPEDRVAELGAQLRDVSSAVCERAESAVLVDVERKFPKRANAKQEEQTRTRAMRRPGDQDGFYPKIATFVEISRLDDWRRAFLEHCSDEKNFDVLVLDVNAIVGNDLEWTSLGLVREFVALFDSVRTVLVKSEALNQWATRIVHGQRWITGAANGPRNRGGGAIKSPKTVATVGVKEYRQTIASTVRPGDAVLEVGCHFGTTTALLHKAAAVAASGGHAIGVDVSPKIIGGAKQKYPEVFFAVGDAWKTAELLRIQRDFLEAKHKLSSELNDRVGFDVVYVDVGGLSGGDGLIEALSLISALMNALEPRCLVIKSLCMRQLSSTLIPHWRQTKD